MFAGKYATDWMWNVVDVRDTGAIFDWFSYFSLGSVCPLVTFLWLKLKIDVFGPVQCLSNLSLKCDHVLSADAQRRMAESPVAKTGIIRLTFCMNSHIPLGLLGGANKIRQTTGSRYLGYSPSDGSGELTSFEMVCFWAHLHAHVGHFSDCITCARFVHH